MNEPTPSIVRSPASRGRRRGIAAALVAVTIMLGASCSTSTGSGEQAKTDGSPTTVADSGGNSDDGSNGGDTADIGDDGGDGGESSPDTTEKKSGGGSDSGSSFCQFANDVDDLDTGADIDTDLMMNDPEAAFQQMKDAMQESRDALDELFDRAPGEIKADVAIIKDAMEQYVDLILDAESFEDLASFDDTDMQMMTDEFTAAADRVTKYLEDKCGIDTDPMD